jgi:hypothetical protein
MNVQLNIWGTLAETALAMDDTLKRVESARDRIRRDTEEFARDARRVDESCKILDRLRRRSPLFSSE